MPIFKRKDSSATWVIFTSDWHVNSTIGLIAGPVLLDEGGVYTPSPEQQWLWERWREFWHDVAQLEGHRISIVVGDSVESHHHGTVQIVSVNQSIEMDMVEAAAKPMLAAVDETYVIRGTEAHAGGAGWKENQLAKRIGAVKDEQVNRYSWWHLARVFGGVKFDIAHHPRTMSHVPHTRDWAPARQATYTWMEYMEDGVTPPDLVIRGHGHYHGKNYHRDTLCIYLPPWQFTTAFGFRRGAGRRVEPPGGVLVRCEGGQYQWEPKRYKVPRPNPW